MTTRSSCGFVVLIVREEAGMESLCWSRQVRAKFDDVTFEGGGDPRPRPGHRQLHRKTSALIAEKKKIKHEQIDSKKFGG